MFIDRSEGRTGDSNMGWSTCNQLNCLEIQKTTTDMTVSIARKEIFQEHEVGMVSCLVLGGVPSKYPILSRYLKTTVQVSDNCEVIFHF